MKTYNIKIALAFVLGIIGTNLNAQETKRVLGTIGNEKLGDDRIVICVLGTQACMPVNIDKTMTVKYRNKDTKLTELPFALYIEAEVDNSKNKITAISVDERKTVICFAEHKKGDDEKLTQLLTALNGVENFKLYPKSNQVYIEYNPKQISYENLEGKVKNAGFILE